jgi:hypothetical protein
MYVNRADAESQTNTMIRQNINDDGTPVTADNGPVRMISLPAALQEKLKEKDTAGAIVAEAERERSPIIIDAETELESAEFQRNSVIQDANSERERVIFKANKDESTVMRELEVLGQQLAISAFDLGITADELLAEVLETQQKGQEQSRSLQLCLADCKNPTAPFSCGVCYITHASGSASNSFVMQLDAP